MLNAANLCPSSGPVLEMLYKVTKDMDQDPSMENRAKLGDGRENTRKLLAEFLKVTPEEIVKVKRSYTGSFLAPVLARRPAKGKRVVAAE